jgi:hypothetical protein
VTTELSEGERKLVECYAGLREVLERHRADLAPFAERNATKALAALWQVMNGLDQDPGQVYDLGA